MNTVLLIGKGYWGKNWYNTLINKSVAFGVVEPKLENGPDQNGIPIYKELEEVDIPHYTHAIVATHAGQHVNVFNYLVKQGMTPGHILVEKPCGSSWLDADQLKECFPGYIQLHSEAFKYISQNINQIGTPHLYKSIRASMGPRIRNDCSVIADYMIHDLYVFFVLFQPFNGIQVVGKKVMNRLVLHGNDTAFVNLYNPDVHILADMFASWWYPLKERRIILSGDKGSFIWSNDELYFNQSRYEPIIGIDSYGNLGYQLINDSNTRIELPNNTAMENELDELLTGKFASNRIYIKPVWDIINKIE